MSFRDAMTRLLYIADPMCSWYYGFGPELDALLRNVPDIPLEMTMGGLRAYNTVPMDDMLRSTLRMHWKKVGETSGLPFCDSALKQPAFIYDTEPACRAVIAVRLLAPPAALDAFRTIQHVFYAEGKDVTQADVLAEIVAPVIGRHGAAVATEAFVHQWSSSESREAVRADFEQVQRWGITGFPTLLLEHQGRLHLIASGFTKSEQLIERVQAICK